MRPRLLDLACGAGGAARGYNDAGFDVTGIDIELQPHYPYEFIQADALEILRMAGLYEYDVIHASFPCQEFTVYRNCRPGQAPRWPDLITPGRPLLELTGLPWIMENVAGAPLRDPIMLCGTSFSDYFAPGLRVRRHRFFESNIPLVGLQCDHGKWTDRPFPGSTNRPNGRTVCNVGEYRVPLDVQKKCMGIDWDVTLHELSEAIPPAYTKFLGHQAISYLAYLAGESV